MREETKKAGSTDEKLLGLYTLDSPLRAILTSTGGLNIETGSPMRGLEMCKAVVGPSRKSDEMWR